MPTAPVRNSRALFRQISPTTADGARAELQSRGLYLDLPPWGYHVFELTA